MDYSLTPTSELDAVNFILSTIGQAPVSTLEVSGIRDVSIARQVLHRVSRSVQSKGWDFNTDEDLPLPLSQTGEAVVPSNCLWIDAHDPNMHVVQRNGKLWDKENHTFTFEEAFTVDIVYFFDFEDLPETARHYIATRAGRIFQSTEVGSRILYEFTAQMEAEAYALLTRAHARVKDANIFKSNSSTTNIFHRYY